MAENKSKPDDQESSEFATQKFTPEELLGEQGAGCETGTGYS